MTSLPASLTAPLQARPVPKIALSTSTLALPRLARPFTPSIHRPVVKTFTTAGSETQAVEERPAAAVPAAADPAARARANALVDELLVLIKDTDSGEDIDKASRLRANDIIRQLETLGTSAPLRPLEDPRIWGNYNVAYVSQGNAQGSPPAGGRFRTGIGKTLFRTTRLCQSVLQPDIVTNKVEARLFGFLPVSVGLRGTLVSIPKRQDGPDTLDTVKVFFEPPELQLPGGLATRFGPPSSVVLTTTYVDERVRLGKGSRGSLFVFTRGGEADLAAMDRIGLNKTTTAGAAIIFALCAGLVVGGGYALQNVALPPPARGAGLLAMLLGAALGSVFVRGGIVDPNNYDRPEVQQAGVAKPAAAI